MVLPHHAASPCHASPKEEQSDRFLLPLTWPKQFGIASARFLYPREAARGGGVPVLDLGAEMDGQHFLSDLASGFGMFVKMSETDLLLLTRYACKRSEDAFAEIVRRHIDLV